MVVGRCVRIICKFIWNFQLNSPCFVGLWIVKSNLEWHCPFMYNIRMGSCISGIESKLIIIHMYSIFLLVLPFISVFFILCLIEWEKHSLFYIKVPKPGNDSSWWTQTIFVKMFFLLTKTKLNWIWCMVGICVCVLQWEFNFSPAQKTFIFSFYFVPSHFPPETNISDSIYNIHHLWTLTERT